MAPASREWRSRATPTNDQTLHQEGNEICRCEKNIKKCRVHFYRNLCDYSFNKQYNTGSVFGTDTKLRRFIQTLHMKSKLKSFSIVFILNLLSEKGQRIRRMSATCNLRINLFLSIFFFVKTNFAGVQSNKKCCYSNLTPFNRLLI